MGAWQEVHDPRASVLQSPALSVGGIRVSRAWRGSFTFEQSQCQILRQPSLMLMWRPETHSPSWESPSWGVSTGVAEPIGMVVWACAVAMNIVATRNIAAEKIGNMVFFIA